MSRAISRGKRYNLPKRVILVAFVYCIKTRRRFSSYAKCTARVSTKFTSLLLAVRTSTVATTSKKSNNDHFHHNFPLWFEDEKFFISGV